MQFLNSIKEQGQLFVSENASVLLTAGGVVGTAATAFLAARGGFKASAELEAEKIIKYSESIKEGDPDAPLVPEDGLLPKLDKLTVLKLAGPHFVPAAITGAATITAIIFAHKISANKIAAMAAAYTLVDRNFDEYRAKVAEKLTGPKTQSIDDEIAQDRVNRTPGYDTVIIVGDNVLCFDEPTGRYFNSNMQAIKSALNALQAEIIHHDHANATFFYDELGMTGTSWSDEHGWNVDHMPDLKISSVVAPDGRPAISIDWKVLPKLDYVPKHY